MSAPLFVGDVVEVQSASTGSVVALRGSEGHHAAAVMRLRVGEPLVISDGAGRILSCRVAALAGRDGVDAHVVAVADTPRASPSFTVVQALPKGDRGELAVELLTEVGVDRIVPWQSERCVTRWSATRAGRGVDRWRSVALAASKQARRPWLPVIPDLHSTEQVCELVRAAAATYVLDEEAEVRYAGLVPPQHGDVVLVVGPEGGLTRSEVQLLGELGGRPVRLGPSILRTSTAGAVAVAVGMVLGGRW